MRKEHYLVLSIGDLTAMLREARKRAKEAGRLPGKSRAFTVVIRNIEINGDQISSWDVANIKNIS